MGEPCSLNLKMKKKKYASLAVLGVSTVIFGGSLVMYVSKTMQPVTVYMYKENITDINSPAKADHFVPVQIPKSAVTNDFLFSLEGIDELSYNTKVYQGQYAYKNQLSTEENLDPFDNMDLSKMRKVSLAVDYVEGLSGNIKRGDKVDIIYASKGQKQEDGYNSSSQYAYSKTIMQDVYVESVSTGDGYKFIDHSKVTSDKATAEQASGDIGIITLAVTLEQAEEIKARQLEGTLSVVGRFNESQSYETLGYVVGDYSKIFSGSASAETGKTTIESNNSK